METSNLSQGSKSRSIPVRLGRVVSASTMAGTGPIPELDNQHFLLSLQIQMDFFNQFCNSYPFPSDSHFVSTPESSSVSDWQTRRTIQANEEVLRASDRPKKCAGRRKFKETRHPVQGSEEEEREHVGVRAAGAQ